jgi:hypothetical protein
LDGATLTTGLVSAPIINYITVALEKTSQNLVLSHTPPLETPLPQLDPTRVSAEQLLFDVATLHSREMLQNLYHQLLQSNHQNLRAEVKDGRLSIYLFGSSVLQIFVGVHDGKFLLQGEGCGSLDRFEDSLNSNTDTFLEIVYELNKASVLDAFKKMKFLFLTSPIVSKVNYNMRESISKDSIYFSFPEFGSTYLLQIQVDSECVPNFFFLSFVTTSERQKISFYLLDHNNKDSVGVPRYGCRVEEAKENNNNNNNNNNHNRNNNNSNNNSNNNIVTENGNNNKRRKLTDSNSNSSSQRKVIPISSLIFESKDNTDLVYQLLNLALTQCRKISQRNFLLEKAQSDGLIFKPIEDEPNTYYCEKFTNHKPKTVNSLNILNSVKFPPLLDIIESAKLVIKEDGFWKVILKENPQERVNLKHVRFVEHKSDSSSKTYYDEENSSWVFEYSTINSNCSFTRFYEFDFLGFKIIQNFVRQLAKWKQEGTDECSSHFEIQTLSGHNLVLVLSTPNETEKYHLDVTWELDKHVITHAIMRVNSNITIIPGSNIQYLQILTSYLSFNQDIVAVLISYARNFQTRIKIEKYLYSNLIHKSIVLHHLKCPITAGKISIINQSIYQFRIVFFQTYAVDVRLFGKSGVVFEDATTNELRENRELTKEMGTLKYMFEVIPGDKYTSNLYPFNTDFAQVFEKYYRYLGNCYLVQHIINNKNLIHNLNTRVSLTTSLPREPPSFVINFKVNGGREVLCGFNPNTGLATLAVKNFCQHFEGILSSYFTNNFGTPPYRPEYLASFINVFDASIPIHGEFCELFVTPPNSDVIGLVIAWDTIQIDNIKQSVIVDVVFYDINQISDRIVVPIKCLSTGCTVLTENILNEILANMFNNTTATLKILINTMTTMSIERFRSFCANSNNSRLLIKNGS